MYTREVKKESIINLFVLMYIYFGVMVPVLSLLGFEIQSSYYAISSFSHSSLYIVIGCHIISIFTLAGLMSRLPSRFFFNVPNIKLLNFFCIVYFILNINLSLELSRVDIKTSASFLSSATTTIIIGYCGAIVFACKNLSKHFFLIAFLIAFIISKGEREYLSLLIVALLLRHKLSFSKLKSWIMLFTFVSIVLFFKGFSMIFKDPTAIVGFNDSSSLFQLSINDSIHVTGLFASYLDGNSPDYRVASVFWPVQLEELFDPTAISNSLIASIYYANLKTGVGFSGMLDFWLNFNIFAPIIFAIFIFLLISFCYKTRSMFLLLCVLTFTIKLMRAELYASAISFLLGPLIIYFACIILLLFFKLRPSPLRN